MTVSSVCGQERGRRRQRHAVDMGMMLQSLVPGVEHAGRSRSPRRGGRDRRRSPAGLRRTGLEEQVVDDALVLEREWSEFTWQREHDVDIAGGQQLLFARLEPAQARVRLASRAMPVATRVIGDGGCMSAVGTAIAMSAERSGAAACDREQDLLMLPGDPVATALNECLPRAANDVGHLQRRPIYALRGCSPVALRVSASRGLAVALR